MLKWTVTGIAAAAGLALGGAVAGLGRLAGGVKNTPVTALSSPTESASAATASATATATPAARPAPTGLKPITISEGSNGQLYVT